MFCSVSVFIKHISKKQKFSYFSPQPHFLFFFSLSAVADDKVKHLHDKCQCVMSVHKMLVFCSVLIIKVHHDDSENMMTPQTPLNAEEFDNEFIDECTDKEKLKYLL